MKEYPKWIFHKTLEAKIVNSKEEHDQAGKGWEETPTAFDKESNEKVAKPASDKGEEGKSKLTEGDFTKMKVAELKEYLVEAGIAADKVEQLKKDELIAMIGRL